MLYYIDKIWHYFIKGYLELFSKLVFEEVARPVGQPNKHSRIEPRTPGLRIQYLNH